MKGAWTVTAYTLKEMSRSHYWITLTILCFSVALGYISMADGGGIEKALTFSSFFARTFLWMAAIYMGVMLPTVEIRDYRIRLILTRPISNFAYLAGKYLAGLAYLSILALCFGVIMYVLSLVKGTGSYPASLYYSMHLVPLFSCHMAMIMAFVLMVPPRPIVGLFAVIAYLDTYFHLTLRALENSSDLWARYLAYPIFFAVIAILPPTEKYLVTYGELAAADFMWISYLWLIVYAFNYAVLSILVGAYFLGNREL